MPTFSEDGEKELGRGSEKKEQTEDADERGWGLDAFACFGRTEQVVDLIG